MTDERTPRASWIDGIVGTVGFAAAHLVVRYGWRDWFAGGPYAPWFLNSGRAAAFTVAWFFAIGALMRVWRGPAGNRRPAAVSAGAVVALIATLVLIGPGTLFPIVVVFGAAAVAGGVFAGWYASQAVADRHS